MSSTSASSGGSVLIRIASPLSIIAGKRSRKAARPGRHLDGGEIAAAVQHAVGELLFLPEQMQYAMLDRILGEPD